MRTKKRGPGDNSRTVEFAAAPYAAGFVVVAAAEGIRFVALGDAEEQLTQAVQEECPGAVPAPRSSLAATAAAKLARFLNGRGPLPEAKLTPAGTAFQKQVWEQLRRIPEGSTVTYSDLARKLGKPAAARAVARACATNPVSVLAPCHRVVRRDGSLGGYRWGVERKRALLRMEGATTAG